MALDTSAILRAVLVVTGTDLYDLVDTRVFTPRLPPSGEWENATAAVVFRRTGGQSADAFQLKRPVYQVECYGGSKDPRDAEAVYDALEARLRGVVNVTTAHGRLLSAVEEVAGQDAFDPVTEWPFVLSFWRVECIGVD